MTDRTYPRPEFPMTRMTRTGPDTQLTQTGNPGSATTTYTGPARQDRIRYLGSLYAAPAGQEPAALTPDQAVVQQLARTMYAVAASENHALSWSRGAVYTSLNKALLTAIKAVYGIGDVRARKVLILLADLGADDSCPGTSGTGVASYVEYVKAHPGLSL